MLNQNFLRRTFQAVLLCLFMLPALSQAQQRDKITTLEENVQSLQKDYFSLQKELLELEKQVVRSGISESTRGDMDKLKEIDVLKANVDKLAAQLEMSGKSSGSAVPADIKGIEKLNDIDGLKSDVKALSASFQKLKQSVEASASKTPEAAPVSSEKAETPPADAMAELTAKVDAVTLGNNLVWTLAMGFLVFFMQAGFSLVEAGFTRKKNAAHTMTMNFMDYSLATLAYWAFGFAIMFGNAAPNTSLGFDKGLTSAAGFTIGETTYTLFGTSGWFLAGQDLFSGGIFTLFLFQLVFAGTANTIPTGALAERWKLGAFTIASIIVGGLIYPLFGHWVWGGGWLAKLGYLDFAGSSVVHMAGGMLALAGAYVVGPRLGKFNPDGSSNPIPGHNLPMAILGTFILAFGWFGFNSGSTLNGGDAQIGIIATNTALASAGGACVAFALTAIRFGRPDPSFSCNGMLGGLVAITAPCAFVDAWAAVLIGSIGGVLVVYSAVFVEEKMKLDDPVGAISVHGVCGGFGCIALGLFANGSYAGVKGLFFGDAHQFMIQCLGVFVCFVAVGGMGWIMFKILDVTVGNRASDADQLEGLDLAEMGVEAYSDEEPIKR